MFFVGVAIGDSSAKSPSSAKSTEYEAHITSADLSWLRY